MIVLHCYRIERFTTFVAFIRAQIRGHFYWRVKNTMDSLNSFSSLQKINIDMNVASSEAITALLVPFFPGEKQPEVAYNEFLGWLCVNRAYNFPNKMFLRKYVRYPWLQQRKP